MKDLAQIFGGGGSVSLDEARLLAIQLLAVLGEQESSGITIGTLFEKYMEDHGRHCKSAKRMRQLYNRHLASWSERKADTLKSQEVQNLHNEIGENTGFATANRVLEIIRAVCNKAVKWRMMAANPCLSVSVFALDSRDRYLSSKDEIHRFFVALETMRSRTFRNFVRTCLYTAARVSNVQSMEWSELDFELKLWRIPAKKVKQRRTKSSDGKPIVIPLIDEAVEAILQQKGKHQRWVFPGRGTTGHLVNPARAWKRLIAKAGIVDLHPHDLRRTMGSWEANTGASLQIIGKTLGHGSLRATHIYARLQLEPVRGAMETAVKAMLQK